MNRVAFYTLGCKLNFSETSAIGRQFSRAGFEKVEFDQQADVYVVNTCSVTDDANGKCRNIIRRAVRTNPEAKVVVVGCYAQLKPQEIADIPGVSLVAGANDKFRILELIDEVQKGEHSCVYNTNIREVNDFVDAYSVGDRTRSFLKLQDGCDYKCTFCTIPLARGASRSDSPENILANVAEIAASGVKEIVLTGVNLGDYTYERGDQTWKFLDIIRQLDAQPGVDRYRISSIEPNLCHNRIIDFVAQSQRFMPHFHIPLQSGSNTVLALMRRRYKRELYADRVAYIRQVLPDACIGVDVITGFPGETDELFRETYDFLNGLDVSYFHVFTYSERENTPAADMAGRVPQNVRKERTEILRILSEKKKRAFYQRFEGQTRPVLVEHAPDEDGNRFGFTDNYLKVLVPAGMAEPGQLVALPLGEVSADGVMLVAGELVQN